MAEFDVSRVLGTAFVVLSVEAPRTLEAVFSGVGILSVHAQVIFQSNGLTPADSNKKIIRTINRMPSEVLFDYPKDKEITWCQILTIGPMLHSCEPDICQIFLNPLRVVNLRIVKMGRHSPFKGLPAL
jgi:hypothetical protein